MLLQIMAILWKERDLLPQSRQELYFSSLKYLLDYRDRRRKLNAKPLLSADQSMRVLEPAALSMQESNSDEISKSLMHERMQTVINTMDDKIKAGDYCVNLRDRAGIIADYGKDAYIFRHKSFREYLAGLQLCKDLAKPAKVETLVERFGQDWWEEPLRFFISATSDDGFDRFMDALFGSDISKNLDQKAQTLLQTMIAEAPQRKTDSLKKRLLSGKINENQGRYILDSLKTIGSKEAHSVIREYCNYANGIKSVIDYAREIAAEAKTVSAQECKTALQQPVDTKRLKSFRNPCEFNAEYILIPGGEFKYSVSGKTEKVPDLFFAKYPVTNKRYRRFISYLRGNEEELLKLMPLELFRDTLLNSAQTIQGFRNYISEDYKIWPDKLVSSYDQEKRFNGDDQPVVCVTWYAAKAYCLWLSLLEKPNNGAQLEDIGNIYKLPDEIEWEWAAAGREPNGGLRKYPWPANKGEPTSELANYSSNVGQTTPVGRYPEGATPEGLMDMAGNVWEWMNNWSVEGKYRALRGGSWYFVDADLRCSARDYDYPINRLNYGVGFRVVRSQS